MTDRNLTQVIVEVPARLAATDNPRRLTHVVVEVPARLAAANNPRLLTQVVVEVAYRLPSNPVAGRFPATAQQAGRFGGVL